MKSTNLQFSQCYIFVGFVNKADIVVDYDKTRYMFKRTRSLSNASA